ncbi:MAG: peptidoglycan DD-metalloendopeptidase family protein [Gallionella sp.]|nr:peptidoglycan DD-metalloendopeptidase family protein [Gallionella sp.]MDP1939307.1 peptidoglycan DD-metalloendopeptidase family protein [Gallionella sp.]
MKRMLAWLAVAVLLAGCATSGQRAPIVERGSAAGKNTARVFSTSDSRPKVYVVQKGDTLFGIAFNYGLDYRELAEMNGIQDPNLIQVGQQINLFSAPERAVVVAESRPVQVKAASLVKEQPKVVKYAYSEAAVAQAEAVQNPPTASERAAPVIAKVESKPVSQLKPEPKPEPKPESAASDGGDDALEWSMPTKGKVVGSFSEADNRKGVDIAGTLGQSVFASAPGKVVYSGSGLRGYGKLLIIKHNKTYISAYAHNDQLLVKEGESVARGQKIAEMGNSDSESGLVKLHFEVRRFGKPVDPANYLSLGKS